MANLGCKPLQEASARQLGAPALFCMVRGALGLSALLNDMGKAGDKLCRRGLAELSLQSRPSADYAAKMTQRHRRPAISYGFAANNQMFMECKTLQSLDPGLPISMRPPLHSHCSLSIPSSSSTSCPRALETDSRVSVFSAIGPSPALTCSMKPSNQLLCQLLPCSSRLA